MFNLGLIKTNTKHCLPTGSKWRPEKLRVLFTIAASHAISIFFLLKFTSQLYKVKIHKPRMHKVRAASNAIIWCLPLSHQCYQLPKAAF